MILASYKLAILIVVHNEKHNLDMLFRSLFNQTFKNFRIYLIDNNSSDGSVEYAVKLNERYLFDLICITLAEDTGYPKGNNIGAEKAINDGFEYLFIINNDIELDVKCIDELLKLIFAEDKAAVVAPIIYYWNKEKTSNKIQTFGVRVNFYTQRKRLLAAGLFLESTSLPEIMRVDYVSGAALLIRSDIVKEYGLFDDSLFMYNDEIDLGYRLKKAGYYYYVTQHAKMWHNHDWTKKNIKGYKFMYYYMMRNRFLYYRKYRLHLFLLFDLFSQLFLFPFKIKMFINIGSFSIIKYYYLGIFRGVIGEKGIASIDFE